MIYVERHARLKRRIHTLRSELGRIPASPNSQTNSVWTCTLQLLLGEMYGLEIGSLRVESPRDGKEEDLCEYLPNAPEDTPFFLCLRSEMKGLLARAVGELPEKERQVLALYYYEELTMKEVGSVMGIGESRVSQIHTMAVIRLRARLQELMAAKGRQARGASAGNIA